MLHPLLSDTATTVKEGLRDVLLSNARQILRIQVLGSLRSADLGSDKRDGPFLPFGGVRKNAYKVSNARIKTRQMVEGN